MLLVLNQARGNNHLLMKHSSPLPCQTCCKPQHSSFHSISNMLWWQLQMLPIEQGMQNHLEQAMQCRNLPVLTLRQQTLVPRP